MENLFDRMLQRTYEATAENVRLRLLVNDNSDDSHVGPEMRVQHSHTYAELFCALSGSLTVRVGGNDFCLTKGQMLLVPAGMEHRKLSADGEWSSFGFSLSRCGEEGGMLRRRLERLEGCETPMFLPGGLVTGLEETVRALAVRPRCIDSMPALRMMLLLADISEALADGEKIPADRLNDLSRDSRLDYLLSECFTENITAAEAARQLHISERQLNRLATGRYGISFGRAMQRQRMISASQLLASGNQTVEEIAARCGYLNKFSFHRAFKAYFGLTPAAYRKKAKEKADS